jgi:hypothetical protein
MEKLTEATHHMYYQYINSLQKPYYKNEHSKFNVILPSKGVT